MDYATRTSSSGFGLQEVERVGVVGYHHGLTEVVTGGRDDGWRTGEIVWVMKKVMSLKEYIQVVLAVVE